MPKKTIRDVELSDRRVLMRVDFNVPVSNGRVTDDRRIREALPTISYALSGGASVVLISHLGRPSGVPNTDRQYQMDPVAACLAELIDRPVRKVDEVVGPNALRVARSLRRGGVLVLENLRFHPGEKGGDAAFAAQLAELSDIYCNDAFGTCHREDASMLAVPRCFEPKDRVIGLLVEKELRILGELMERPKRPLVAILGGAKVEDKIGLIGALVGRVDQLLVGGAMTYTFAKAAGRSIGNSKVENAKLDDARRLAELAGPKLLLAHDHLITPYSAVDSKPVENGPTREVRSEIPDGWCGVDIGRETIDAFARSIAGAGMVVWNGPMGKFEDERFASGTRAVACALAASQGVTVVGGGETAEAVQQFGVADRMTHVSTGGGAFLEYLEGKSFASLQVIDEV